MAMVDPAKAVQDFYPSDFAHCYGCGRLNEHGLHIQSAWEGDEVVARFLPREEHVSVPGFVYGGLLASLVDCHAMAAAAADAERRAGRAIGEREAPRYVTAVLHVEYLKPTPLGAQLEVRARIREGGERKTRVDVVIVAGGSVCVKGEVVAVPMPATMRRR
jgi:acyl-coenzyme A thioesterase PaaI-like protein